MLRIGLIGASRIATTAIIAPARCLDNISVVGVAARDPARAAAYAREHGIACASPSYEALLARDDIDLIYVSTPPNHHAGAACAALRAGKSVLVEKPFTMNAAEAQEVLSLAEQTGGHVFEAMHSLHHALFGRLKELVGSGPLGRIQRLHASFEAPIARNTGDFRWSDALGGGALMDLGVYPITWCRYLAGDSFTVEAASARFDGDVDWSLGATLGFSAGVSAGIACSMVASAVSARLLIEAERGRIHVDNPLVPHLGHRMTIYDADGDWQDAVEGPSTYEAQLVAVRNTVLDGVAFPLGRLDPLRSMEALDQIRAAVRAP